uniref:Uncharacterized protein n=1 Tax=Triticum urartu TaxID=4572 RepID=A0A8R7QQ43_TRIUA
MCASSSGRRIHLRVRCSSSTIYPSCALTTSGTTIGPDHLCPVVRGSVNSGLHPGLALQHVFVKYVDLGRNCVQGHRECWYIADLDHCLRSYSKGTRGFMGKGHHRFIVS